MGPHLDTPWGLDTPWHPSLTPRGTPPNQVEAHGSAEDRECLHYILHEAAGSSATLFPNSAYPRDCDASGATHPDRRNADGSGMRFEDFVRRSAERHTCRPLTLTLAFAL